MSELCATKNPEGGVPSTGGPWRKDRHTSEGLNLAEAMARVKTSLEACIDVGYALLHIDPTVGAIVEGIDDIPGSSMFDVHTRLNVNVLSHLKQ